MKPFELARHALGGLWRQKVRTALTLIGVAVGTCALAFSLALGFGLRSFIEHEFTGREDFWRVLVHLAEPANDPKDVPGDRAIVTGRMSEERRTRIREAITDRYFATRPRKGPATLTPEKLAAIAALPGVLEVRSFLTADGRVTAPGAPRPAPAGTVAGPLAELKPRLLAGRLPEPGAREILLSELVLHDLGIDDDADLEKAIGREVQLTIGGVRNEPPLALALALTGRHPGDELTPAQAAVLGKLVQQLPGRIGAFDLTPAEAAELAALLGVKADLADSRPAASGATATGTFRICGVVRVVTREERKKKTPLEAWELLRGEAFLMPKVGEELIARLPWGRSADVLSADVRIRPGSDLPGTVAAIEAMGFRTYSGAKWFASARREVTLIAAGLNLFAMIALLVACIGITNTLVTSVVERTREIGILRAVGATRTQILGLFLAEGTVIGLAGSLIGLGLARALAVPADRWVWGMIEKLSEGEKLLGTTVFEFPAWLYFSSVGFAVVVTTAAAYYPARRAAQIHPIEALRYG